MITGLEAGRQAEIFLEVGVVMLAPRSARNKNRPDVGSAPGMNC
jgi:hypothetical protein